MSRNRKKQKQVRLLRWAALLPVRERGATLTGMHRITTLAADEKEAGELAQSAGLVFLGGPVDETETNDNNR